MKCFSCCASIEEHEDFCPKCSCSVVKTKPSLPKFEVVVGGRIYQTSAPSVKKARINALFKFATEVGSSVKLVQYRVKKGLIKVSEKEIL